MINSIGLQNIRSLLNTNLDGEGCIQLKPFNVLLGKNSSGKSTFLRLFPLLKQSVTGRTRGALAFFGDEVDFGDYKTVISKINNEVTASEIKIKYKGSFNGISSRYSRAFSQEEEEKQVKYDMEVSIKNYEKKDYPYISSILINCFGNKIEFSMKKDDSIDEFYVNGQSFVDMFENVQVKYDQSFPAFPTFSTKSSSLGPYGLWEPFVECLAGQKNVDANTFELIRTFNSFTINDSVNMKTGLMQICSQRESRLILRNYHKKIIEILDNEVEYERLYNAIIFAKFEDIYSAIVNDLVLNIRMISYSKPLRANADRYYRSRTLFVNEINSDGSNLVEFFSNLEEPLQNSLKDWMNGQFGFCYYVKSNEEGHKSIYIQEKDNSQHNITDMGFGYSQILPIITQLWVLIMKRQKVPVNFIYSIEQPELHLHPSLQCKLINALANVSQIAIENQIRVSFIIETHSETIINQFGRLIKRNKIKNEDVNVLIFSKDTPSSETKIKTSEYKEDGILTKWPIGFFGEEECILR